MGADLVWHPRPAALADAQAVEPVALELWLPAVIGRAGDPHLPAGLAHRAQLLGQRKEPQAVAEQDVIMGHRACSFRASMCGDSVLEMACGRPRQAPGPSSLQ